MLEPKNGDGGNRTHATFPAKIRAFARAGWRWLFGPRDADGEDAGDGTRYEDAR